MSTTDSSLSCAPRYATPRDPSRATRGGEVAKIAEALGTPLMPWQRLVADVAMEIDPATGKLAYREVVITVPRQSGKTTLILALMVHRALMIDPPARITYTAQTRLDARKKWEDDHIEALQASLFRKQFTVRKMIGQEAIIWANGSMHGIAATTEKAGHGSTLDLGVIDEAFAHPDARVEQAMKPAMITRPQPQLVIASTAGTQTSIYLNGKIEKGRELVSAGGSGSIAYFEWSAGDDVDLADQSLWPTFMPAIGHSQSIAAVASQFESMEFDEFARAFGNRCHVKDSFDPVIPSDSWAAARDPRSQIEGYVVFGVDIAPSRRQATISVAGLSTDGKFHVEVVDQREDVAWLVPRLSELVSRWDCSVIVDSAGPAASFVPDIERLGVAVAQTSWRDVSAACGQFFDAVIAGGLVHIGQDPLDTAVAGASKRDLGDAWAWSRRHSRIDITPLVAATLALWEFRKSQVEQQPSVPSLAFI